MDISLTPWLWVNLLLLGLLVGAGWALGTFLVGALFGAVAKARRQE